MASLKIISSDESSHAALAKDNGARSDLTNELRQMAERWEGRAVVAHYDLPTRSWVFIAMHDTTLGAAAGGCRMSTYAQPTEALRDAMRLAEAMTRKWAVIDFDFGGGKAVLSIPHPLEGRERAGLFERFGHLLEKLGGTFITGEDLGTTPADMARLAGVTRYARGLDRSTGRLIEPGPYTALGILGGIHAALAQTYGTMRAEGRTVLVQGVGHVGAPLARLLRQEGADLILCDADEQRMRALARELECRSVTTSNMLETRCDIYAPCAMGGILNRQSVPRLSCRIVAGAANNQLETTDIADALHERGILYAPDYVINAGGAIALSLLHRGANETDARSQVEGIADTLGRIFDEANAHNESPLHAAERKVERVLKRARQKAEGMAS